MSVPLQDSILSQSAVTVGVVAASRGEVEKDAHHEEAVRRFLFLWLLDTGALVSC